MNADEKEGYQCEVCYAASYPAQGGRRGFETLHANWCHAVQKLIRRQEKFETEVRSALSALTEGRNA